MKKLAFYFLTLILIIGTIITVVVVLILKDLPGPELLENRQVAESTKIYDREGKILLYEIYGEEKRTIIPFEEIPLYIKQATIAVEDINFYKHPAFDFKSMIRALLKNLVKGRIVQGGSTITQQLAKNSFLTPERTITRKIKELILAFRLEKQFTKDEILNLYLNQIPYGLNSYGVEAASQTFFNKPAEKLSLPEAALLAALPKAPSYYSPHGSHVDELLIRKDYVLEKMVEAGFITQKEKEKAVQVKLKFSSLVAKIKAPHFVIMIQEYLNGQYGEEFIRTSGLKIITTLDWNLQQLAEKVVREGAKRNEELYQGKNAALVAQDAKTGQILALVGSRDYFDIENEGNFNVAVQGLRQPGSAMKPFVYIAAFKKGYSPETVIFDVETEFNTTKKPEKSYKPKNWDEKFRGPVTMRQGLAQSINIPSVKTLYLAGLNETLKTTWDFGLTTLTEKSRYGLSLVLGGGEVKLIDLVNAYSVFAREGIKHKQSFILQIKDKSGKIIEGYQDQTQRVIEPQYPRMINDVLSDVETRSDLFQNSLSLTIFPDQEVALKTGTTDDHRDAWTVGYTPSLVVGVWAGNNDNKPFQEKAGSIVAAIPIWSAFMKEALRDRPTELFNQPEPIFQTKPVLGGDYIVNYEIDGKNYPQIHNILYYVDKKNPRGAQLKNPENDPQFENWEKPVIEWLQINIPNFSALYNQPLPSDTWIINQSTPEFNTLTIEIINPEEGEFISGQLNLNILVKSGLEISKIETYFNNVLIDWQIGNFGKNYSYIKTLNLTNIDLQNSLKITAIDVVGNKKEKEIIIFKS
jgi:1A family penicillin-binding protein